MCSDWRTSEDKKELTLTEIAEIHRNRIFSSVKRISLSGGEPTMRADLMQVARIILDSCPQIKEMMLITNGLEPDLVTEKVRQLISLCKQNNLKRLSVSVSLDGYGEVHEKIRGTPRAFEKATETIRNLKMLQSKESFYLCSSCVVQPTNIDTLVQLLKFTRELKLPITLVPIRKPLAFMNDSNEKYPLTLSREHVQKLKYLFDQQLKPYLVPSNVVFWQEYFNIRSGLKRNLPCYMLHDFAEIDSDGTLRICVQRNSLLCGNVLNEPPDRIWYSKQVKELRKRSKKELCTKCADCCDLDTALKEEFFYYARHWLKQKTSSLMVR